MKRSRWRPWAWPSELRERGILGINHRNAIYVLPENPRSYYPQVDDKQRTKQLCEARGIRVPPTYAVIERHGDAHKFLDLIGPRQEFVIKPAGGAEGRGILVIVEHDGKDFLTPGGERTTLAYLRYHLLTILSGLYSLGGQPDRAIIEQRIVPHPVFENLAVGGTPDIRIILYRCVPVMAMVRLPTQSSRGRANLHQGAVAAAVHLKTGRTFGGVYKTRPTSVHPDTDRSIDGLPIPSWDALLAASMDLAEGLRIGYLGIDFALDATLGPVVLEANARPGLAIQIANRRGLLRRLQRIKNQPAGTLTPEHRMKLVEALAEMS